MTILDDICNGGELDSIVDEELLGVDDVDDDEDVADGDEDGNDDGQIFIFFEFNVFRLLLRNVAS